VKNIEPDDKTLEVSAVERETLKAPVSERLCAAGWKCAIASSKLPSRRTTLDLERRAEEIEQEHSSLYLQRTAGLGQSVGDDDPPTPQKKRPKKAAAMLGGVASEPQGGRAMNRWAWLILLAAASRAGLPDRSGSPGAADTAGVQAVPSAPVRPEQVTEQNANEIADRLKEEIDRELYATPAGRR